MIKSKGLYLLKDFIEDKNITDEGFCVLAALRNIMIKDKYTYFISYNYISYNIYSRVPNRYELSSIKSGVNNLKSKKLFNIISQYSNSEFECDLSSLYYDSNEKKKYANVLYDDLIKIMSINTTINKYKIFRYYSCLIGTFNNSNNIDAKYRGKVGGLSLDEFSKKLSYSIKTIIEYNKILEDNKLIYVVRHKDYIKYNPDKEYGLKELPNSYCRYEDKDLLLEFLSKQNNTLYSPITKNKRTKEANTKRGLAQKYAAVCRGKKYDCRTLQEIYAYCIEWNKEMENEYMSAIDKGYSPVEPEYKDINMLLHLIESE